jgi:5-methylcytosine-specific restriction endonuclease McrA
MVKSEHINFSLERFRNSKIMDGDYRTDFSIKEITTVINITKCCSICGSNKRLELDHVIPVVFGGKPIMTNSQVLCVYCHRKKTEIDKLIWFSFKYLKYVVKGVDWSFFVSKEEAQEYYTFHYNRIVKMKENNILNDDLKFNFDFL